MSGKNCISLTFTRTLLNKRYRQYWWSIFLNGAGHAPDAQPFASYLGSPSERSLLTVKYTVVELVSRPRIFVHARARVRSAAPRTREGHLASPSCEHLNRAPCSNQSRFQWETNRNGYWTLAVLVSTRGSRTTLPSCPDPFQRGSHSTSLVTILAATRPVKSESVSSAACQRQHPVLGENFVVVAASGAPSFALLSARSLEEYVGEKIAVSAATTATPPIASANTPTAEAICFLSNPPLASSSRSRRCVSSVVVILCVVIVFVDHQKELFFFGSVLRRIMTCRRIHI